MYLLLSHKIVPNGSDLEIHFDFGGFYILLMSDVNPWRGKHKSNLSQLLNMYVNPFRRKGKTQLNQ